MWVSNRIRVNLIFIFITIAILFDSLVTIVLFILSSSESNCMPCVPKVSCNGTCTCSWIDVVVFSSVAWAFFPHDKISNWCDNVS
jgi:hypothetical protein